MNRLGGTKRTAELVTVFKRYGVSLADIAEVVHEDVKVVSGWETDGTKPGPKTYTKLIGLHAILMVLADSLSMRGVGQWLHTGNRILDGQRPLDALSEGQDHEVMEAANAFVDGSYV